MIEDLFMNRVLVIIMTLSLLGNIALIYLVFKAYSYRKEAGSVRENYYKEINGFSGWSKYHGENEKLKSESIVENRVVFLGASITEEWDLNKYFNGYEIINRGLTGQRIGGYLLRFKSDVLDLKPKAVVIKMCSVNFRPYLTKEMDEIADHFISMAKMASAEHITPIFATIVPITKSGEQYGPYVIKDKILQMNSWIREYCSDNGLPIIDYYEAMATDDGYMPEEISVDTVHPNEKGYELMSEAAKPVINKILNRAK
jgi:alpha-L-fucosidase